MADKTSDEQIAVTEYVRNTLFTSEVSALKDEEHLQVSARKDGKVFFTTNVSGLDLETKFQTALDGGDSNLTGWSL